MKNKLYELTLKEVETIIEKSKNIKEPDLTLGSYDPLDCVFLLKDINGLLEEEDNLTREKKKAQGVHYCEMLPIEYEPTKEYVDLFHSSLKESAKEIADHVGNVAEKIYAERGNDVVLVSLARAGSPIGVLIKRYLLLKYDINVPHYSISIIRGKGIDENAIFYILGKHMTANIQFIDGWTGKGAINGVLHQAVEKFEKDYGISLNPAMAVLADPSKAVSVYGTREDYLIPSACLNSTVSGLMSRTVLNDDIIGEHDFHGAKYYKKWQGDDLSNRYVNFITKHFNYSNTKDLTLGQIKNSGMKEVKRVMKDFDMTDINKIKPGVGETTRVLLRRVPWKIIVKDRNDKKLKHIIMLAEDRDVPIEEYKDMSYRCMGLIKSFDA